MGCARPGYRGVWRALWYETTSAVFSSASGEVGGRAWEEGREEQLSPVISEQTAISEKIDRCFYAAV